MHINIYEIIAVFISLCSFIYGIIFLSKKKTFNRLYLYAAGCYLLEELWVIVNSSFGHIDSLVTVRLFGIIGTYSFLLTAGINEFDGINNKDASYKLISLILPVIFLVLFLINKIYIYNENVILGLIVLCPMLIASYFNLKGILLSKKYNKLKKYRLINIVTIIFYILNFLYYYPFISSNTDILVLYDILVSMVLFILIVLNKREAYK